MESISGKLSIFGHAVQIDLREFFKACAHDRRADTNEGHFGQHAAFSTLNELSIENNSADTKVSTATKAMFKVQSCDGQRLYRRLLTCAWLLPKITQKNVARQENEWEALLQESSQDLP